MQSSLGPVFIGGCDRSGTTMIASMLGGHPSINCLPESHFIFEYARTNASVPELLERVLQHGRFRLWGIALRGEQLERLRAAHDFGTLVSLLAGFYAEYHGREARPLWLDHAPRSVTAFSRLADTFPRARFIHVIRDGRSVAASWLKQDWGPRHILTVADTWSARIAQGLSAELAMPGKVLRLHYEEVVRTPEKIMRQTADFLSIDFNPAMLEARGFILPAHSTGTHGLLAGDSKAGVSADRLGTWLNELSTRQIELFEQRCGDLLPLLGYPLTQLAPDGPTRSEAVGMLLGELWGRFINLRRRKRRHSLSLAA